MDQPRGTHLGASKPGDAPEVLLDVFKAAALSVTKLYRTSANVERKARSEGYQECLDDLLAYLDKENLGLGDGQGWMVRRWATERLDSATVPTTESDEEADRNASPEITRTSTEPQPPQPPRTRTASPPTTTTTTTTTTERVDPPTTPTFVVPTQEAFTFQAAHPYPDIATLDLSDGRPIKGRGGRGSRARAASGLGRGAGTKRRANYEDFFGGYLGGKDKDFIGGGKRSRHG